MTKKKYELTPEHRAQLSPWADRWIKIAMRSSPQTEADRTLMIEAVNGLYDAAKLDRPKHIVFVPSPIVGQVASGFAAAVWHLSEKRNATENATWNATRNATENATEAATENATEDATEAATWNATRNATEAATEAATRNATEAATEAATRNATENATWNATEAATEAATWNATEAATWNATENATWNATRNATWNATEAKNGWARRLAKTIAPAAADFLCGCAVSAMNMYSGGNMWPSYPAFISFFRHIAKLSLDYSKWQHYETASIHGGFRFMHPKFCMVVDFPEFIKIDQSNRPHCEDGPSHKWRDGYEIFYWHGFRIPDEQAWVIADKSKLNADKIDAEKNAEMRRVMLEIYGFDKYAAEREAKIISSDEIHGQARDLLELKVGDEKVMAIRVINGTVEAGGERRKFILGAARNSQTREAPQTPHEAIANSYGINQKHYREAVRT